MFSVWVHVHYLVVFLYSGCKPQNMKAASVRVNELTFTPNIGNVYEIKRYTYLHGIKGPVRLH